MYKILILLKKKVCLSLANDNKTIDDKLRAFCGKSYNYFIDTTYRNITESLEIKGITFSESTSKKIMRYFV